MVSSSDCPQVLPRLGVKKTTTDLQDLFHVSTLITLITKDLLKGLSLSLLNLIFNHETNRSIQRHQADQDLE